jgi:hypothetical protein
VAQGPGWWIASDGKWYPPETHPSYSVPAAPEPAPAPVGAAPLDPDGALPTLFPTTPRGPWVPVNSASGIPLATSPVVGRNQAPWGDTTEFSHTELYAGGSARAGVQSSSRYRSIFDPRGAFFTLTCLAVLAMTTILPWYSVTITLSSASVTVQRLHLTDHIFPTWHIAIPILAGVGILLGVANSLLRPTDRGAVTAYVLLRVVGLALVALMILAAFWVQLPGLHLHTVFAPTVNRLWPCYASIGAGVVGLAGQLTSTTKEH